MILVAEAEFIYRLRSATPVMSKDNALPFDLPSVCRKKLSVGFDGGQLFIGRGRSVAAQCPRDGSGSPGAFSNVPEGTKRDPDLILHTVEEMLQLRIFAIASGCEDLPTIAIG